MNRLPNTSNPEKKNLSSESGFTLIEVLIALVVVSIALSALSVGLGQFVYQSAGLQDRIYASWVAQNRLYEIAINQNRASDKKTRSTLMGRNWTTAFSYKNTAISNIYQIEIDAWPTDNPKGEQAPDIRLYSIMGKPH